ncbi:MAG: NAC family transcription factor [Methanomicrobiales archaeon]|nr:NAC family transcription factor [Methanomicrobiales archaeon]
MTADEGEYCKVCGGMVPKAGDVRQITVHGKMVGINGLDHILMQVKELNLSGPTQVKEALFTAVKVANYIPTKKAAAYEDALYREYLSYITSKK